MLSIQQLSISTEQDGCPRNLVSNISFDIPRGQLVALIGESGSGKSITSASILRLLPDNLYPTGKILLNSESQEIDLLQCNDKVLRSVRGKKIAMIFQEPMTSLNPLMRCGKQMEEALMTEPSMSKKTAKDKTIDLLQKMGLQDPKRIYDSFPHQLSGGQKQRVMIAMAMSGQPELLIADEPTTALDVTIQKEILDLLQTLKKEIQLSILLITHDMGIVADYADQVAVMQNGKIIESGSTDDVIQKPQETYTKSLIQPFSQPNFKRLILNRDDSPKKNALLSIHELTIEYPNKQSPKKAFKAVDRLSMEIAAGEIIGLAGESGSGKSSLGKTLVGLVSPTSGKILFYGNDVSVFNKKDAKRFKQQVQMVFQDPYGSLNPKLKIGDAVLEVMRFHEIGRNEPERLQKLYYLLDRLGLQHQDATLYPHQFSGGQRQRISILRALATEPQLLIFDEAISALDTARQRVILELIHQLKSEFGFAALFISHDLRAMASISDRILVLKSGKLLHFDEKDVSGHTQDMDYFKKLLSALPGQSIFPHRFNEFS